MPSRWKRGALAGQGYKNPDGDMVFSRTVIDPRGRRRVMIEVVGFRGEGAERQKVVLDRFIQPLHGMME